MSARFNSNDNGAAWRNDPAGAGARKVMDSQYGRTPPMLLTGTGCKCPVCGREWQLHGQGQGFVKAGAWRHISACYAKTLADRGVQLGMWDDEKQAHLFVPL